MRMYYLNRYVFNIVLLSQMLTMVKTCRDYTSYFIHDLIQAFLFLPVDIKFVVQIC